MRPKRQPGFPHVQLQVTLSMGITAENGPSADAGRCGLPLAREAQQPVPDFKAPWEDKRMIAAPLAQPPPENRKAQLGECPTVAPAARSRWGGDATARTTIDIPAVESSEHRGSTECHESREIVVLLSLMFLILVLPAVLMLTYVLLNPDAFQYDISPRSDFSATPHGEPFTPREVTTVEQDPR